MPENAECRICKSDMELIETKVIASTKYKILMQEMPSSSSEKRKVNNSLSSTLFNYVIPFFSQKYVVKEENTRNKKGKSIKENGIKKEKSRLEILLLEELIFSQINNNKKEKGKEKIKVKRKINDVLDEFGNIDENIGKINKNNEKIDYLLELTKENIWEKLYSISIKYEENSEEEKLDITIKLKHYSLNKLDNSIDKNPIKSNSINEINNKNIEKDKEEIYSISIANKK